ncbi:cytochrome c oxidase assembly protein [Azoarcus indigens]|uniref:Putative membrane protein n=1 Tax=Azoarcus indigens TaxID=29545 RepID=A0A4R6ECM2_9RHOO|nr:cytochrome c oxidase assembly protein [Azoarcus indigens]NMG65944.1 cytochrome c oxidase assembly protein [Azoarcus indigens]TDN55907.1 putative membrane protein [Azoarcus indigens]
MSVKYPAGAGRAVRTALAAGAPPGLRHAAALLATALLGAAPALAHNPLDAGQPDRLPLLAGALLMTAAWLLYLRGARLRPPPPGARTAFHAGMAIAVLAVFGPLDEWAETSTAMHMIQHMAFMVVIAPLWALAAPLPQWRAALGGHGRPLWRALIRAGRQPAASATVHGAVVWIWHVPALYLLALEDPWWHMVEHACFLFTAWLFWWAALRAARAEVGAALVAVTVTLMHTGLLGALMTFATVPFYGPERSVADQQLAGLIMWVPGSLFYLAGAGWMTWRWLERGQASERVIAREEESG